MIFPTILFKYRSAISGQASQFTTDFNAPLYAGCRSDRYKLFCENDPLGKCRYKTGVFGFDFGFFGGIGTTPVNLFTTANKTENEYSGMILQGGDAGFIESRYASFGLAIGMDRLMTKDNRIWIYSGQPWFGFIIGMALN